MWLWRPVDEHKSYAFHPVGTEENSLIGDDENGDEEAEKILLEEF
jgi:hypothetical protein